MSARRERPSYFQYWGKTRPGSDAGAQYHLLPHHCLDVAATGRAYLERRCRLLEFFARNLALPSTTVLDWVAFWLALHDLGKFAETFQSQRSDLFSDLKRPPPKLTNYGVRHDTLGARLWHKALRKALNEAHEPWVERYQHGIACWVSAVTGHHGMPPADQGTPFVLSDHFTAADERAAFEFVQAMRPLLLPDTSVELLCSLDRQAFLHASTRLSWWVAGVAVLADWIGSNTDFFKYRADPTELAKYWKYAQGQATVALARTGVLPGKPTPAKPIGDLFPYVKVPTPLQQWAAHCQIFDRPALYVLEDMTGAGKTEAAVMLAQRLLAAERADGLFFALPTMATANAMFKRLSPIGAKLFDERTPPSIVLAHGQRHLSPEFNAAVIPDVAPEDDSWQRDETAGARCAAWLADSNKKALLAQVGVGTIDQALLGVLHARHQSLRLLGLFGKVLVVDEVHACDAYVLKLLSVVLRFHAASGGSAILLSATLPKATKQKLLDAFAQGMQGLTAHAPVVVSDDYPLATTFTPGSTLEELPVPTRAQLERDVAVSVTHDVNRVVDHLVATTQAGRCAVWIRNTVRDALAAYLLLAQRLPPQRLRLFHARFAMGDRLDIEAELEVRFGPKSSADERAGFVVVATQVVEQSLDVDFDEMVTDLAPVDRVVQRAGRLHRHLRDERGNLTSSGKDGRGQPCLMIYAPEWTDSPDASWFKSAFPYAQKVYPDPAVLWLSLREVRNGYRLPEQGRSLIEAVYAGDPPAGLQHIAERAQGDDRASASVAHDNSIKLEDGYLVGNVLDWWRDAITPSRLGEKTVIVRLAHWENGGLGAWCPGDDAWDMSSVRVAERDFGSEAPLTEASAVQAENLKRTWSDRGRWSYLLVLSRSDTGDWVGQGFDGRGKRRRWRYDAAFGLRWEKDE